MSESARWKEWEFDEARSYLENILGEDYIMTMTLKQMIEFALRKALQKREKV